MNFSKISFFVRDFFSSYIQKEKDQFILDFYFSNILENP